MLFKSGTITQASGSFGGMTASHNKGGMYMRARTIPTNPASTFQAIIRQNVSDLVNRWENVLTSTQRAAWNVYAANVTVLNKLGDAIHLSGQNWYIGCNTSRPLSALAYVDDAPTIFNTGAGNPPTIDSWTPATPSVDLAFVAADAWASEDGAAMQIYASRPQNAGISFFKGPYRFAGSILGDATTPPTSPATIPLPFAVAVGEKVFFRGRLVRADGRRSINLTMSGIVS